MESQPQNPEFRKHQLGELQDKDPVYTYNNKVISLAETVCNSFLQKLKLDHDC